MSRVDILSMKARVGQKASGKKTKGVAHALQSPRVDITVQFKSETINVQMSV